MFYEQAVYERGTRMVTVLLDVRGRKIIQYSYAGLISLFKVKEAKRHIFGVQRTETKRENNSHVTTKHAKDPLQIQRKQLFIVSRQKVIG